MTGPESRQPADRALIDLQGPEQAPSTEPSPAGPTTGAHVLGGGAWQVASRLLPQATNVILSIAIARLLGPEDFGRQSFIAFVSLSLTSLLSAGLSTALMRYSAEYLGRGKENALRSMVTWTGAIQLGGALVGGAILALAGVLGAEPVAAWQFAALATSLAIMQTVPSGLLLGTQRFREAAKIGLTTNLIFVPATIAVVAAGGGIAAIFAVQALVAAVNLAWTTVVGRTALREVSPLNGSVGAGWHSPFLRFSALITADTLLGLIVWRRSEFFFLDAYSTNTEIGIYSIAFASVTALSLVPQTLAATVAPAFANLFGAGDMERIRSGYGRQIRLLTLGTLPLTAAALALGPAAIELLYGSAYSEAGPVLVVMLVLLPLAPVYFSSESLLTGLGRPLVPLILAAIASVVNIGLDFLLIPRWDAIGAAAASTLAQAVVMVPLTVYTRRVVGPTPLHLAVLLRAALACVAAGGAAWGVWLALGGVGGFLLALVVGAAIFAVLSASLRVLPRDDAEWLDRAAGARLGGWVGRVCRATATRPAKTSGAT